MAEAEPKLPSTVNNSARALMSELVTAHIRDAWRLHKTHMRLKRARAAKRRPKQWAK